MSRPLGWNIIETIHVGISQLARARLWKRAMRPLSLTRTRYIDYLVVVPPRVARIGLYFDSRGAGLGRWFSTIVDVAPSVAFDGVPLVQCKTGIIEHLYM